MGFNSRLALALGSQTFRSVTIRFARIASTTTSDINCYAITLHVRARTNRDQVRSEIPPAAAEVRTPPKTRVEVMWLEGLTLGRFNFKPARAGRTVSSPWRRRIGANLSCRIRSCPVA